MREFNLLKIYLVIIAIVGIIGAVSGYGNVGYQAIKYRLISPEEYLVGSYENYQIKQCEDPLITPSKEPGATPVGTTTKTRTPEEIAKCKADAEKSILARRDYEYKDGIISGLVWGTIFLVLFGTHFPVFFKKYREDKKERK